MSRIDELTATGAVQAIDAGPAEQQIAERRLDLRLGHAGGVVRQRGPIGAEGGIVGQRIGERIDVAGAGQERQQFDAFRRRELGRRVDRVGAVGLEVDGLRRARGAHAGCGWATEGVECMRPREGCGEAPVVAFVGASDVGAVHGDRLNGSSLRLRMPTRHPAKLGQRLQLAGIADTVLVGVLPDAEAGEIGVGCVVPEARREGDDLAVAIRIERFENLEAVLFCVGPSVAHTATGLSCVGPSVAHMATGPGTLAAFGCPLRNRRDGSIAVAVVDEDAIVTHHPACTLGEAVAFLEDAGRLTGQIAPTRHCWCPPEGTVEPAAR